MRERRLYLLCRLIPRLVFVQCLSCDVARVVLLVRFLSRLRFRIRVRAYLFAVMLLLLLDFLVVRYISGIGHDVLLG